MTKRTSSIVVMAAILGILGPPAAFAQEADSDDPSAMVEVAEEALGLSEPEETEMAAIASLPGIPDSGVFVALQGGLPYLNGGAQLQAPGEAGIEIAQGPGPGGPGGPGGPDGGWRGRGGEHGKGMCGPGGGKGCPMGFGHHRGPFGILQGPLALTDDQYERLYSIKNSSSDAMAPKKTALREATRDLFDALSRDNQDSGKIKSLQSQIASLKADLSSAETNKLVQMSQVLTADQRKAMHMAMIKASLSGFGRHHKRH